MLYEVAIRGTGAFMPSGRLTSAELDARFGMAPGHFEAKTGISVRPVCAGGENSVTMAVEASRAAIADAGLEPGDVDLVISGCAVPHQPIPAMGPLIQRRLGLASSGVAGFDVNATCLSFVVGCETASALIAAGRHRNVLVVSSEMSSRGLPWADAPDTAAMFGDGAAAAVLSRSERGGFAAFGMQSWPDAYETCEIRSGGTRYSLREQPGEFEAGSYFRMDGFGVFKAAFKVIEPFVDGLLARAGWTRADVDLLVPHQASRLGVDHVLRMLGIGRERVVDILADHGNQISVSIPAAIDAARRAGRIPSGARVLCVGTSAGLSVGGFAMVAE